MITPPYLLYLGNAPDELSIKTARGLAVWRPGLCIGQHRGPECKATLDLPDMGFAEAREAGNVGIYRGSGEVREGLVQEILTQIPGEKILWEAPQKAQQLYFIELLGCNVNLGNIAPTEMISLEAMRVGLRGDTFSLFLNKEEV